ncbi:lipocalin-like domain-containing protein [Azospirillum sp. SYSU D00513]|uniref:lipocalin-like domain-containing protein n=1 Tax=Azospirillum sp. SYSU D00513 TaxID=2812561 RepID=UPI001A978B0F|nr:lipocalin-like domain-containing protein [Azospirillum sp. SYSU D00513]
MLRIQGQWQLLRWVRLTDTGEVTWPFGQSATGMLIYADDGRMMVQMMAGNRPNLNTDNPLTGDTDARAAAYSSYLAYFGTFRIDRSDDRAVIHQIEGSSFPDWSGTVQERPFTLEREDDGEKFTDILTLSTPPVRIDGIAVVNEMAWIRNSRR